MTNIWVSAVLKGVLNILTESCLWRSQVGSALTWSQEFKAENDSFEVESISHHW